jgi:DNA replication and repair protein RecF
LKTLIDYKRNLGQKNALLRKGGNTRQLSYWNSNLEETGSALIDRRERFVSDLSGVFARRTGDLLPRRKITLSYTPSVRLGKGVLDGFTEEEKRIGFSVYGPHRDRFDIEVDGRSPTAAASEGEKRLTILALYLSVKEFLKQVMGEEPVLLMDEPFGILSEEFIESLVNELDGQVILTAIGPVLGLQPQISLQ